MRFAVGCAWILLLVGPPAAGQVRVVATVGDLAAIAREVGGDRVRVDLLARPTQDPHYVDPKPSLVVTLSRAELLLHVGMDLEAGWLPTLLTSSRNPAIQPGQPGHLDASTLVEPLDVPSRRVDRSMGDIHPTGNPHYTKDPRQGIRVARGLAERLAAVDPPNAAAYGEGARRFSESLARRIQGWEQALAPFRATPVVPYHKSWRYFTAWAGLEEVAYVEPKPGIPPSAAHLARVLGVLKRRGVPVILQEDWYSAASTQTLARNSRARLVRVAGMSREGETYGEHLDEVVREVVSGLAAPAN